MRKINLLVIVEKYLESKYHGLTFVHSRLIGYDKERFNIKVLSFGATENYIVDGIQVLCPGEISKELFAQQDWVQSHAPNLKHHVYYLRKYFPYIKKLMFFFHGHEVLMRKNYYPKPYAFVARNKIREIVDVLYDFVKLAILRLIFKSWAARKEVHFVFVSQWMLNEFRYNLGFDPPLDKTHIIHNPINNIFYERSYNFNSPKPYDFICIRSLDESKYAVDLVLEIAKANPQYNFHIYGQGKFFEYYEKPPNVVHHSRFLKHFEIADELNKFKAAIMLTRLDAQGVMMCEMANFGIPLVTSDLPICREMLDEFQNVKFVNLNSVKDLELREILKFTFESNRKSKKFSQSVTINEEQSLLLNTASQ